MTPPCVHTHVCNRAPTGNKPTVPRQYFPEPSRPSHPARQSGVVVPGAWKVHSTDGPVAFAISKAQQEVNPEQGGAQG